MGKIKPSEIRRIILDQSKRANVGHIGSALSIADIIAVLYDGILNIPTPDDPERDRFILSKGHAVLAQYAALYLKGWLDGDELNTYCTDGSALAVHPDHKLGGVDLSTGSLGQGLSMGIGCALGAKLEGSDRLTYVLVSDAECNEGSLWEGVMFAAHHKLSNLIVIIDANGQQALDYTENVINLSPLEQKWEAFGWDAHVVDGHNAEELRSTLQGLGKTTDAPHVIVAQTVFGKGVSYMHNKIKWHYWPMSDDEYCEACREIDETGT